ncbi:site-specific integrase [Vibrio parahaemolyticus]|uniref:site-specific integrase n=1 Tax=Vibrio parahaemolyticus TaxID=670 RepID=UPI001A8C9588|nr:site-specific integrase [Vibrio parahaemolyticus]MBO0177212.1 site-specific integrase [Vibrio parahaemolyticus]MDF4288803.1 site-specific integrase [Vibrio parahaemolyticus]MDF4303198.1 site-specific integrase [Vibrio parahaemolyticus]MDF5288478.1 site-specific integrase [Vibrio parahaemolyticus]MDF5293654.1 site-specific integrase [Vibrio parahaemolyticus]
MYLYKNRHSNYYSRICIPKHLRLLGFPDEIRFSLETKIRSEGLDRSLPIAMVAREWFKSIANQSIVSVDEALDQLRHSVSLIKRNDFGVTFVASKRTPKKDKSLKCNAKKSSRPAKKCNNEMWLEKFLAYKANDGIRHSSVQQLGARSRLFLSVITKPLSQLTTKDALDFKAYLIASDKGHKTQKEILASVKQFIKWLRLQNVISTSPFEGIVIKQPTKKASEDRQRWSQESLQLLFNHSNFAKLPNELTPQNKREDFWIPLMLLYSGARTGEICQLMSRDIVQVKGFWCIDINDRGVDRHLKTAAAKRLVPIHQQLIDWGLLEYVQERRQQGKTNLFDLTPSGADKDWYKNFSTRFARVLKSLGLVGRQRPTLHSFRHTFIDELQQQGVPENETSELVGHTKLGMSYGRYGKTVNIERLNSAVQSIHFDLAFAFSLAERT